MPDLGPSLPDSSGQDDPLRALLDALAHQADLLSRYLDQLYEESYVGTAGHPAFTVRTEADGTTVIRFGDGEAGRRPPAGRGSVVVEYRVGGGTAGNLGGQGATDANSLPEVHRAVVVGADDPEGLGRLLVRVPSLSGDTTAWALPVFPPRTGADRPAVGSAVWVLFETGDPSLPVWLGAIVERHDPGRPG